MRTNKRHFKQFCKSFLKYLDFFGVTGWEVLFYHDDPDDEDIDAYVRANIQNRTILVGLYKEISREDVDFLAFHEAAEVFLYKLRYLADSRYIVKDEIDEEVHNLIRVLESRFFGGKKR